MPLYMDFHKFPKITIDEAKKAHVADERIQKKYGVKYHQFWVNEEGGTLFCLVEGPDKLTCESVHKMAHGHVACAMVEVDPSYYALVMGENIRIDQGVVHDENGLVDLGYRSILAVTVKARPPVSLTKRGAAAVRSKTFDYLRTPVKARESVLREISKFNGRLIKLIGDDSLVSVFNSPIQAINCATAIRNRIRSQNKKVKGSSLTFSLGLSAGQPVTEDNEFIEDTIRLAKRLSLAAGEDGVLLSPLIHELCEEDLAKKGGIGIKSVSATEEVFLTELFGIIDAQLSDENFNINSLVRAIGISRPQLYRKIHGLMGKAPNDLIRDLRLDKSLSLLKRKSGNISEVALEVGFNSSSYFAKCFARKFRCTPSQFAVMAAI